MPKTHSHRSLLCCSFSYSAFAALSHRCFFARTWLTWRLWQLVSSNKQCPQKKKSKLHYAIAGHYLRSLHHTTEQVEELEVEKRLAFFRLSRPGKADRPAFLRLRALLTQSRDSCRRPLCITSGKARLEQTGQSRQSTRRPSWPCRSDSPGLIGLINHWVDDIHSIDR